MQKRQVRWLVVPAAERGVLPFGPGCPCYPAGMPLSWNEIRHRAIAFSKEWRGETREAAERQSFWNDFFNVFGVRRRTVASFEEPVKKLSDDWGFIGYLESLGTYHRPVIWALESNTTLMLSVTRSN
jgi:hypothetical protein